MTSVRPTRPRRNAAPILHSCELLSADPPPPAQPDAASAGGTA